MPSIVIIVICSWFYSSCILTVTVILLRKQSRDMWWCVRNAEKETIADLSSRLSLAYFRRVHSVPRSPRLYTPSNFWFTRPRWNSMNAKCNPLHNPFHPPSLSRPVSSGHITTPHPMWNFAFQSCPRSNKRRQLPTGNIFSTKGWAIYLKKKRLDTSGNTRESGSTGVSRSHLRKIRRSYYKIEKLFITLQTICERQ